MPVEREECGLTQGWNVVYVLGVYKPRDLPC